jgi:hypothetical protein
VYISMKSDVYTLQTRDIKSLLKYDDGKWWDVSLFQVVSFPPFPATLKE